MRYIEAPEDWQPGMSTDPSVFLAGGITGCPDWQAQFVTFLADHGVTLLNPRRANFPIGDPDAARGQIEWEHRHLRRADAIVFWFCAATIQPIALYELGAWSMTHKPLAIGVEPGYEREQDVRIQTELARPDVKIVDSLRALAKAVVPGDMTL